MIEQRIEEVTRANRAFYEAFESLDVAEMDTIWAHQEYVTCIHPGWSLRSGWPSVFVRRSRGRPQPGCSAPRSETG